MFRAISTYKVEECLQNTTGPPRVISVIKITQKSTGRQKAFGIGTNAWRILYFTQFRENSESCSNISSKMPWDVQQDIAHFVWENF